jgi:glyceraldehyde 3-phosphate dehydrogenase
VLDRRIGVRQAIMTTVHAYTSSQQLIDGPARDFRRGRAEAFTALGLPAPDLSQVQP